MKKIVVFCFVVLMFFILTTIISRLELRNYYFHIMIIIGLFSILSSSLDILMGYTAQMALCYAALYGIGAFSSTLLVMNYGFSFWIALPISGLIASFMGVSIGLPSFRLKAIYFAIITFSFGGIIKIVMDNWKGLTGGVEGIRNIPFPNPIELFGLTINFHSKIEFVYLIYAFVCLTILVKMRVVNSRVGRAFMSIGYDEELARSIGINAAYYKLLSFGISAFFAGLAGSLYAHYMRYISPDSFTPSHSFELLVIVVVGGMGTIIGPIIGAIFWVALPETMRVMGDYTFVLYGLIVIVVIIVMPRGIAGGLGKLFSILLVGSGKKRLWTFWKSRT